MKSEAAIGFLMLILVGGAQTHAQTACFPLHVGDRWQYAYFTPPTSQSFFVQVIGDTVLPGGHSFAILIRGDGLPTEYLRQSGDSVFIYNPYLKHDFVYYDFSRQPGDTVNSIVMGSDTMDIVFQGVYSGTIFGGSLREWWFGVNPVRHSVDLEFNVAVVDSIGVFIVHPSFADTYNLQGAVINGRVYGTIDAVRATGQFRGKGFALSQNYPNPFNPSTTIRFALPRRSHVTMTVFNTLGQAVVTLINENQDAGYHDVRFDGSGLASGVYFYRFTAGTYAETTKMLLIK